MGNLTQIERIINKSLETESKDKYTQKSSFRKATDWELRFGDGHLITAVSTTVVGTHVNLSLVRTDGITVLRIPLFTKQESGLYKKVTIRPNYGIVKASSWANLNSYVKDKDGSFGTVYTNNKRLKKIWKILLSGEPKDLISFLYDTVENKTGYRPSNTYLAFSFISTLSGNTLGFVLRNYGDIELTTAERTSLWFERKLLAKVIGRVDRTIEFATEGKFKNIESLERNQ